MKTLAAMKMEKNFIGVLEKGYSRKPYEVCDSTFLLIRIYEELDELEEELCNGRTEAAKLEIADVSNILDFLFELISQ